MSSRSSTRQCSACLSPYRHRNLHSDSSDPQRLSPFEVDTVPTLWRDALIKNPLFCEHVAHWWITSCIRKKAQLPNQKIPQPTVPDVTQPDCATVAKEGERILLLINSLVEAIEKREEVAEKREVLMSFATSQGWLGGWGPRWWGKRKEALSSIALLADALVEQFVAQLDMEDVHERELLLLVWKHFMLAVVSALQDVLRKGTRSVLSLSLSMESTTSSDTAITSSSSSSSSSSS